MVGRGVENQPGLGVSSTALLDCTGASSIYDGIESRWIVQGEVRENKPLKDQRTANGRKRYQMGRQDKWRRFW